VNIRPLTTIEECRQVAALEREIWGFTDSEDVVPPPILIVSTKRGGILLGAFDDAERMCGFVYSLPALKDGVVTQWSDMLGVIAPLRGSGLGGQLKLAQRQRALAMGMELIEWTFDPLQAANAHFNFAKLGVVVEEYEENLYGVTTSALHAGAPTDRFVAAWYLTRPHVERRIAAWGQPIVRDQSVASAVLINPSVEEAGGLAPGRADLAVDARRVLVEIPDGFTEMLASRPSVALAWRLHTREIFQTYLSRGYRIVDFFQSREGRRGHYLVASPA
jgi:chorismate synthase